MEAKSSILKLKLLKADISFHPLAKGPHQSMPVTAPFLKMKIGSQSKSSEVTFGIIFIHKFMNFLIKEPNLNLKMPLNLK